MLHRKWTRFPLSQPKWIHRYGGKWSISIAPWCWSSEKYRPYVVVLCNGWIVLLDIVDICLRCFLSSKISFSSAGSRIDFEIDKKIYFLAVLSCRGVWCFYPGLVDRVMRSVESEISGWWFGQSKEKIEKKGFLLAHPHPKIRRTHTHT